MPPADRNDQPTRSPAELSDDAAQVGAAGAAPHGRSSRRRRRARGEERESAPVERAAALEPPQFELPKPDQTMPPVAMAAPAGGTLRFDAEADAYLFTTTG